MTNLVALETIPVIVRAMGDLFDNSEAGLTVDERLRQAEAVLIQHEVYSQLFPLSQRWYLAVQESSKEKTNPTCRVTSSPIVTDYQSFATESSRSELEVTLAKHLTSYRAGPGSPIDLVVTQPQYLESVQKVLRQVGYSPQILK